MLSIGKLTAGGEDYYLQAVAAGVEDYYLGAGEAPGRWLTGAGALGLAGEVAPDDLRAVLAGRAPGGDQLAAAPPGRARVPGYDLTFSAPKSVSLLHALGKPQVQSEVLVVGLHRALTGLEATRLYLVRGEPLRDLVADELGGRHAAERRELWEELAADLARSRARQLVIDVGTSQ